MALKTPIFNPQNTEKWLMERRSVSHFSYVTAVTFPIYSSCIFPKSYEKKPLRGMKKEGLGSFLGWSG